MITKQTIKDFKTFEELNSFLERTTPATPEIAQDSRGRIYIRLSEGGESANIRVSTISKKIIELLKNCELSDSKEKAALNSIFNKFINMPVDKKAIMFDVLYNKELYNKELPNFSRPFLAMTSTPMPPLYSYPFKNEPTTSSETSSSLSELLKGHRRARDPRVVPQQVVLYPADEAHRTFNVQDEVNFGFAGEIEDQVPQILDVEQEVCFEIEIPEATYFDEHSTIGADIPFSHLY